MNNYQNDGKNHLNDHPIDPKLRRKATKAWETEIQEPDNIAKMTSEEIQRNIQELQIHQIELTMQNEELLRIQNDLESARSKYAHLYDFAPIGYFTVDENGVIVEANLTFCTMLGIERNQVIGKMFTRFIRKEDQDIFYLHRRNLLDLKLQQSCELRLVQKNGHDVYVYLECMILENKSGKSEFIRATVNDITEKKQAQAKLKLFRDLINQTNDAIYVIDAHTGDILDTNDKAVDDLNYSRKEILSLKISDIENRLADPVEWIKYVMMVQQNGSHLMDTEHRRSDGTQFPVEVNSRFIRHGEKQFIVIAARDILERQSMEKQLRHMQKMNSLGTMAGGIAHEFNNLLHQISGNAELILDTIGGEEREFAEEVFNATQRGARLVKHMLTFSRQSDIIFQVTNLNHLIIKHKVILDRLMPEKIQIRLELADNLFPVNTDHSQMEQVLLNLCLNAKDAMKNGGILTIRTENSFINDSLHKQFPHMQMGKSVLLSVTDTGHGIEQKIMDKIFDPFFTTKEVGKGTGLGLSIVYGIIKDHHGLVFCSSNEGFGTTFNVYLPVETLESTGSDAAEEFEMLPVEGCGKILIVEDDRDTLSITGKMLEHNNYSVITAKNGESAFDLYAKNRQEIDLIILDLGMPGMGGIKCLQRLKELDSDVKVIIASGYSDDHIKQVAEDYGASGYITKPYKLAKMSNLLREVLDKRE